MTRVTWSDQALQELDQIVSYIDVFDPRSALRVRERLINASLSLEHFPNRGRPAPANTRVLVTVPPYVIRYRVGDGRDEVVILTVRHSARLPDDTLR